MNRLQVILLIIYVNSGVSEIIFGDLTEVGVFDKPTLPYWVFHPKFPLFPTFSSHDFSGTSSSLSSIIIDTTTPVIPTSKGTTTTLPSIFTSTSTISSSTITAAPDIDIDFGIDSLIDYGIWIILPLIAVILLTMIAWYLKKKFGEPHGSYLIPRDPTILIPTTTVTYSRFNSRDTIDTRDLLFLESRV